MSRRAERRSRDARNFESEAAGYSSRRLGYEETIDLFLQQQGLADPLAYDRAARIRMNSPRNRGDEQKAWAMQEKRLAMYDFSTRASRGDDASSVTLPEGVSLHSEGEPSSSSYDFSTRGANLASGAEHSGPSPAPAPSPAPSLSYDFSIESSSPPYDFSTRGRNLASGAEHSAPSPAPVPSPAPSPSYDFSTKRTSVLPELVPHPMSRDVVVAEDGDEEGDHDPEAWREQMKRDRKQALLLAKQDREAFEKERRAEVELTVYDESKDTLRRAQGEPRNEELNYLHEAPTPIKYGKQLPRRPDGSEVRTKNSKMVEAIVASTLRQAKEQMVLQSLEPTRSLQAVRPEARAATKAAEVALRDPNITLRGMHVTFDPKAAYDPKAASPWDPTDAGGSARAIESVSDSRALMLEFEETGTTAEYDAERAHSELLASLSSRDAMAGSRSGLHAVRGLGRGGNPRRARTFEMHTFKERTDDAFESLRSASVKTGPKEGQDARTSRLALEKRMQDENDKRVKSMMKREAMAAARKLYLEAGTSQADAADFERMEKAKAKELLVSEQREGAKLFAFRGLRYMLSNIAVAAISITHYQLQLSKSLPMRANATDGFRTPFDSSEDWMSSVYLVQMVGAISGVLGVAVQYVQYMQYLSTCCGFRTVNPFMETPHIELHAMTFTINCMYMSFTMQVFSWFAHVQLLIGDYTDVLAHLVAQTDSIVEAYRIVMLIVHFLLPALILLVLLDSKYLTHTAFPMMFGRAKAVQAVLKTQWYNNVVLAFVISGLFVWLIASMQTEWLSFHSAVPFYDLLVIQYRNLLSVLQGVCNFILVIINFMVIRLNAKYDAAFEDMKKIIEEIMGTMRVPIYKGNKALVVNSFLKPKYNGQRVTILADLVDCKQTGEGQALVPVSVEGAFETITLEEFQLGPDVPKEELPKLKEQAELRRLQVSSDVYELKQVLDLWVKASNMFMFFLIALVIAQLVINTIDRSFLSNALFMYVIHAVIPVCGPGMLPSDYQCINPLSRIVGRLTLPEATGPNRMLIQQKTCAKWTECIVRSVDDEAAGAACGQCKIPSSDLSIPLGSPDTFQPGDPSFVPQFHAVGRENFLDPSGGTDPIQAIITNIAIGGSVALILGVLWARSFKLKGAGFLAFMLISAVLGAIMGVGIAPFFDSFAPQVTLYDNLGRVVPNTPGSEICGAVDMGHGPANPSVWGISNLCMLEIGKYEINRLDFLTGGILTWGLSLNTLFLMLDMEDTQAKITVQASGPNAWAMQLANLYVVLSCVIYAPFRLGSVILMNNAESIPPIFGLLQLYENLSEAAVRVKDWSTFWYGPNLFEWVDQRGSLMMVQAQRLSMSHMIEQGYLQTAFLFAACNYGWYKMRQTPIDQYGMRDAEALTSKFGVFFIVVFGYLVSAILDGALAFLFMWSADIIFNMNGLILIVKLIIGAFFLKSCLQSDILPLWRYAPSPPRLRLLFYLFIGVLPYGSIVGFTIAHYSIEYAQESVQNMARFKFNDAKRELEDTYNVTYTSTAQFAAYNLTYTLPSTRYDHYYTWLPLVWYVTFVLVLVYSFFFTIVLRMVVYSRLTMALSYVNQKMIPEVLYWTSRACPCCTVDLEAYGLQAVDDDFSDGVGDVRRHARGGNANRTDNKVETLSGPIVYSTETDDSIFG